MKACTGCPDGAWRNFDDRPRQRRTPSAERPASQSGEEKTWPDPVGRCMPPRCVFAHYCRRRSPTGIGCRCLALDDSGCVGLGGDREKHFEKLSVGNVRRVEGNLYGFGVPGVSRADDFVFSRGRRTGGVPGSGTLDAFDMLENSLDPPEAAVCDNRSLFPGPWFDRRIHDRIGENNLDPA